MNIEDKLKTKDFATLAKRWEEHSHKVTFPAYVSPKLDGIRGLYYRGKFYSRNGKVWNDALVEHIVSVLQKYVPDTVVLDGEFFIIGWPRQRINSAIAVKRLEPSEDTKHVQFHIFDTYSSINFYNRLQEVEKIVNKCNSELVQDVPAFEIITNQEAMDYCKRFENCKYEGAIVRWGNGGYIHKRTDKLLKMKSFLDAEFEIVGFTEGRDTDKGGRLLGTLGAIIVQVSPNITTQVGSGFSDEQRDEIWNNKAKYLGQMVTVKYFGYTPDGKLDLPIFLGFRDYE